ncbi:MAG: glycerophosphodiester phosphodiesterase [Oscillospiraceae bacterium]|nr:glycerophosphodiester phosphodiesterase [Oscillospiraceae bacterium]
METEKDFTYTAHTGCVNTPDNSLESIDSGIMFNAQIVEIDLNFSEKGEPLLSHNKPKGGEITLENAFMRISSYENLKVNIDVKNRRYLEKVPLLAKKYGILDRIFFTGIEPEAADEVRTACPNIPFYLNIDVLSAEEHNEEYLLSLVKIVKDKKAIGINFNKENASKELVDIFHKNNLLVSIWTVDKDEDIYRILSYMPDNITTRRPDKLNEIKNKNFLNL